MSEPENNSYRDWSTSKTTARKSAAEIQESLFAAEKETPPPPVKIATSQAGSSDAKKPIAAAISTPPTKPASSKPSTARQRQPQRRLSKKNMTIVMVAMMFVVDVLAVGVMFMIRSPEAEAAVNNNPIDLISGQLASNHGQAIAYITYHPELTYSSYQITKGSSLLKPLSNNYLTTVGKGEESQVILIDETAISRLLAFNSDWVAYQNNNNPAVFDNVLAGSQAEQFVNQHAGFKIAFHRLAIGELSSDSQYVYVLAQPVYTLLKDGQAVTVSDVCLFVFVKQGDTLVLVAIEPQKPPSTDVEVTENSNPVDPQSEVQP
jgi:hypothetical protein